MSKHRRARPRYGRIAAASLSLIVTAVALLSGVGIINTGTPGSPAAGDTVVDTTRAAGASTDSSAAKAKSGSDATSTPSTATTPKTKSTPTSTPSADDRSKTAQGSRSLQGNALPSGTGSGRRVVFSEGAQRVWLVGADDEVVSTYLVSGSLTDNLHPGSYDVYSKSRWAVGVDDSGVMQYFVRFTRGDNAAIGFHSIPTKNGQALQTKAQLGTPQSHGCIRQKLADAQRLWDFASVGTDVVVV